MRRTRPAALVCGRAPAARHARYVASCAITALSIPAPRKVSANAAGMMPITVAARNVPSRIPISAATKLIRKKGNGTSRRNSR